MSEYRLGAHRLFRAENLGKWISVSRAEVVTAFAQTPRNRKARLSLRRNNPVFLVRLVMGNDEEYRRHAAEAQSWAEDRAAWLRVAQGWLRLIKDRPPSEEETFEQRSVAEGTGQERSNKSH
jgi:hypothetical protein